MLGLFIDHSSPCFIRYDSNLQPKTKKKKKKKKTRKTHTHLLQTLLLKPPSRNAKGEGGGERTRFQVEINKHKQIPHPSAYHPTILSSFEYLS